MTNSRADDPIAQPLKEEKLSDVFDVAAYILSKHKRLDTMKLQKLVYYSQSWHAVRAGVPLFTEPIKAWTDGPVVGLLWHPFRGCRYVSIDDVSHWKTSALSTEQRAVVDAVLEKYATRSGAELSDLTHQEEPWLAARASRRRGGTDKISVDSLRSYYARVLVEHPEECPAIPSMGITYVPSGFLEDDSADDTSRLEARYRAALALVEA